MLDLLGRMDLPARQVNRPQISLKGKGREIEKMCLEPALGWGFDVAQDSP